MSIDDLATVFKRRRNGVKQDVCNGRFPIEMLKAGRHRFAKTRDVAEYLAGLESA